MCIHFSWNKVKEPTRYKVERLFSSLYANEEGNIYDVLVNNMLKSSVFLQNLDMNGYWSTHKSSKFPEFLKIF